MSRQEKNLQLAKIDQKFSFKRIILLFILALFVLGLAFLYFYAQKPAQGVAGSQISSQLAVSGNEEPPRIFEGKYLTFSYDGSYALKTHEIDLKPEAIILESAYLSQNLAISKKIGLTIRNLPSQNFEDDPSFKMRTLESEIYQKKEFDFGNVGGIFFTSTQQGSFEKTFFIKHQSFLLILTTTVPGAEDEKNNKETDEIIKSISWL